jgi:hypothetical protein
MIFANEFLDSLTRLAPQKKRAALLPIVDHCRKLFGTPRSMRLGNAKSGRDRFPCLSRERRLGSCRRFAFWHNLDRRYNTPFDSSDHRPVAHAVERERDESALIPQTIDQSTFASAKHFLRKRRKISERPRQTSALEKGQFQVTRSHRRVQFKNTVGDFFNPHQRPTEQERSTNCLPSKAAIIAPTLGHGKHFCENMQIFLKRAQFEKRPGLAVGQFLPKLALAATPQISSGSRSIRSRVAATPIPFPSDRSIRTTEASQTVHPPGPRPAFGGSIRTSSIFEPVSSAESVYRNMPDEVRSRVRPEISG